MATDDLILIGRLTRTQGHRGALRLLPEFDPPKRIEQLKTDELLLEMPNGSRQAFHLDEFSYHQQCIIVTLKEVPDMNAAEKVRGAAVYVREADLWDLDPDEFLAHQVEGFQVIATDTAQEIGAVTGVQYGSAHDYLKVRTPQNKILLVPLVKAVVSVVDHEKKTIAVSLPPGLDEI